MDMDIEKDNCQFKYNIRKQKSSNTSTSSSSLSISLTSSLKRMENMEEMQIKIESDSSSTDTELFPTFYTENSQSGEIIMASTSSFTATGQEDSCTATASATATPSTSSATATAAPSSSLNKTALIALQQLASISSTHSIERLLPQLPKDLLAQNETLVYAGRPDTLAKDDDDLLMASNSQQRYPCRVCGKSYLRKAHLKRHITNECIGIEPKFLCEFCPSRYKRNEDLKRHMLKVHHMMLPKSRTSIDSYIDEATVVYGNSCGPQSFMSSPLVPDSQQASAYSNGQRHRQHHNQDYHRRSPPPLSPPVRSQHHHLPYRRQTSASSDFDNQYFLDY
ncbi:early growth response protein 1-A [Stomoxys calcitrans]|uniref:C2H2-type domain-containing protein n=1 Tax=Stomoxys calcitrans TaxID=35570 RepID=A0A1I8PQQ5_STOCA|nr:early growth response protein 1-A [Stomoxys calcitrans]